MKRNVIRGSWFAAALAVAAVVACGGGGGVEEGPVPVTGFGVLSGKTVLVLPVQYVRRVPGGWPGRQSGAKEAARAADAEIAFALDEFGGRAVWVKPEQQVRALQQQPSIQGVNPYLLSADKLRAEGKDAKSFRDDLYSETRMISALFDARYAIWPLEVISVEGEDGSGDRLAVRSFLLDMRAGAVLWYGVVIGDDQPPASPGALAGLAQAFAELVSP